MKLSDFIYITKRLERAFPQSFITCNLEFIAHKSANEYFCMKDCETEFDIKCKVLEQFSRGAHKTLPYNSDLKNKRFHDFMLNGINKFLGTRFTEDEIALVYDRLGNGVNHALTVEFVNSGYDMAVLAERGKE